MALNCLSSAGYVLYMRKRIRHFNFKDFDTVYYNNMLSLPVMVLFSLCLEGWMSGELERTLYVVQSHRVGRSNRGKQKLIGQRYSLR